jgi:uncharacterized protein YjbI with pentapeptide repeats
MDNVMNREELNKILENHKLRLEYKSSNLYKPNLQGANLKVVNLTEADLGDNY